MQQDDKLYVMTKGNTTVVELGEPTIMQLNIPSIPDEEIPVGQLIVLWDEIPIRKIGEMIYEVYANCEPINVKDQFPGITEMAERPSLLNTALRMVEDYKEIESFMHFSIPEPPRYITNSRGQKKKRNYWESPKHF